MHTHLKTRGPIVGTGGPCTALSIRINPRGDINQTLDMPGRRDYQRTKENPNHSRWQTRLTAGKVPPKRENEHVSHPFHAYGPGKHSFLWLKSEAGQSFGLRSYGNSPVVSSQNHSAKYESTKSIFALVVVVTERPTKTNDSKICSSSRFWCRVNIHPPSLEIFLPQRLAHSDADLSGSTPVLKESVFRIQSCDC